VPPTLAGLAPPFPRRTGLTSSFIADSLGFAADPLRPRGTLLTTRSIAFAPGEAPLDPLAISAFRYDTHWC
jgi:hypothetical protein